MNSVRLVHILCSIWPYENGLIKQFKHKDQCHICNASPTYFGKFLFLWKTCFNLYLKWDMTFRSPHPLFAFSFSFGFFYEKKKWPNFISTHQRLLKEKYLQKFFFKKSFLKKFLSWILFFVKDCLKILLLKLFTKDFFSKTFLFCPFFKSPFPKKFTKDLKILFLGKFSLQNI